MPFKVFFCRPSGRAEYHLVRVSRDRTCGATGRNYCRGERVIWTGPEAELEQNNQWPANTDPRWPTVCQDCGRGLGDDASRSAGSRRIYIREDTGEEVQLGQAPVGACWDADWYHDHRTGPDGRSLIVKTPGGDWFIDSRASNCTRKDDNTHRCWVRHGKPEDGTLHVDKDGDTCAAGAGSIMCGDYHGFLKNGFLTDG